MLKITFGLVFSSIRQVVPLISTCYLPATLQDSAQAVPALVIRSTCLIRLLILIGHLYLSGMWLGVPPRTDTAKACV
jgi:hypothetical protein